MNDNICKILCGFVKKLNNAFYSDYASVFFNKKVYFVAFEIVQRY